MNLFRELFLKNLGLKGISLLLGLLLWNQVTSQETVQRTVSAPIVFRQMPAGLEISNEHLTDTDVMLRVREDVPVEQVTAVVDLQSSVVGMNVISLTDEDITRPSGSEVLGITPSRIRIHLENTTSKRVTVEPDLQGEPAEGYEVTGLQVVPPDILISGPESQVQEVSSASTGPINIDGQSETFSETVFADLENPRLRIGGASNVDVIVSIEEKRRTVRIANVKVTTEPAEFTTRIYDKKVTLEGTIPISFSGEIEAELFTAFVDMSEFEVQREPVEVEPRILIPEEYLGVFRISEVVPPQVRVRRTK